MRGLYFCSQYIIKSCREEYRFCLREMVVFDRVKSCLIVLPFLFFSPIETWLLISKINVSFILKCYFLHTLFAPAIGTVIVHVMMFYKDCFIMQVNIAYPTLATDPNRVRRTIGCFAKLNLLQAKTAFLNMW